MLEVHDGLFDKRYIDELSHRLVNGTWYANNVANRSSWPYGELGTHRLLGHSIFNRLDNNRIRYSNDEFMVNSLTNAFEYVCNRLNKKLLLDQIDCNLQFKDMDGTAHKDGNENQTVFILMLSNEHIIEDIGGEFIHIPSNSTIKFKQGRLIEFTANELHLGKAFNVPNICRFSIKFMGTNIN